MRREHMPVQHYVSRAVQAQIDARKRMTARIRFGDWNAVDDLRNARVRVPGEDRVDRALWQRTGDLEDLGVGRAAAQIVGIPEIVTISARVGDPDYDLRSFGAQGFGLMLQDWRERVDVQPREPGRGHDAWRLVREQTDEANAHAANRD